MQISHHWGDKHSQRGHPRTLPQRKRGEGKIHFHLTIFSWQRSLVCNPYFPVLSEVHNFSEKFYREYHVKFWQNMLTQTNAAALLVFILLLKDENLLGFCHIKGLWRISHLILMCVGCSVVSDSLLPHGLYIPWNSPG